MPKRKLTQEDLDNNPELVEQGLKVGDEAEIPEANESNESSSTSDSDDDEEGGGGNHPTDPSGKP